MSQQMLDRVGELLVDVFGEGSTGVVGQDPYEHDGIVLDMGAIVVVFGEKLADLGSSCLGGLGTCDGGFNDGRQVEDFFALDQSVGDSVCLSRRHLPSSPRRIRRRVSVGVSAFLKRDGTCDSPPPSRHWPRGCRHCHCRAPLVLRNDVNPERQP